MTTQKQKKAAKKNIKKAQQKWQDMSSRERSLSQPEGSTRQQPGQSGDGDYYHVEVRDKNQFTSFRTHDVGDKGGIQRVAGHRNNGSWDTQKWLISKTFAHASDGKLIADHNDAKEVLKSLGSAPEHVKGDIFKAKPRENVAEEDKPTEVQQQARCENIKKAQEAAHTKHQSRS